MGCGFSELMVVKTEVHLLPFFVHVSSKGSGETACKGRFVRDYAAHGCDNYQNLVYCLLSYFSAEI